MKTIASITMLPSYVEGQIVQLVDARLLHRYLEVGRNFSNWIKGRIKKFGFEEDTDYFTDNHLSDEEPDDCPDPENNPHGCNLDTPNRAYQDSHGGDRRSIDYYITLDMAKELAMVERTPLFHRV